MKTSISTFPYFYYSLEDAIERIASFGYDGVEIWGGTPHAYAYDMTSEKIEKIRDMVRNAGLNISGFIPAQFRYPTNIAIDDDIIRNRSIDYLKKSIDIAVALGAPLISICPGHARFGQSYESAWSNMIDSISKLMEYSGNTINLMLEPGNRYETDLVVTAEDGKRVVKDLGNRIGLVLDTGHMFVNRESVSDGFLGIENNMLHFHIDDNMGVTDDHMVPGTGRMDYEVFFQNLKRINYEGYITVELGFQYCTDPDPAVLKSLKFINSKIAVNNREGLE
ncbi:MAG TPA: TIM barrel protein [Thermoanaerobacterales bacterium]|nr:TIM barrel protein [Thermoanaerobacterales bacterium]